MRDHSIILDRERKITNLNYQNTHLILASGLTVMEKLQNLQKFHHKMLGLYRGVAFLEACIECYKTNF